MHVRTLTFEGQLEVANETGTALPPFLIGVALGVPSLGSVSPRDESAIADGLAVGQRLLTKIETACRFDFGRLRPQECPVEIEVRVAGLTSRQDLRCLGQGWPWAGAWWRPWRREPVLAFDHGSASAGVWARVADGRLRLSRRTTAVNVAVPGQIEPRRSLMPGAEKAMLAGFEGR